MIDKEYVIENYTLRGSNITGFHSPWDGILTTIDNILDKYQGDRYEYLFTYLSRRNSLSLVIFDFEEYQVYEYYCNGLARQNKDGEFEEVKITYQLRSNGFENYRKLIKFFKNTPIIPLIDIHDSKFVFYIRFVDTKTNDEVDRVINISENDEIFFNDQYLQYHNHLSLFRDIAMKYGVVYEMTYSSIKFDRSNNIRISYKNRDYENIDPSKENEYVSGDYYIDRGIDLVIHLPKDNQEKTLRCLNQLYHVITSVILKGLDDGEEAIKTYLENKVPFMNWFK